MHRLHQRLALSSILAAAFALGACAGEPKPAASPNPASAASSPPAAAPAGIDPSTAAATKETATATWLRADLQSDDEAVRALAERCRDKDGSACSQLAQPSLTTDRKRAAYYYQRGCDLADMPGCFGLGYMLTTASDDLPADVPRALILLDQSCKGDIANGCSMLGLQHYWGANGQPIDHPRSAPYFRKACALGETEVACANLAMMMVHKEIPGDDEEAGVLFKRGCDDGVAMSCFNTGLFALEGVNQWTRAEAQAFFERGCTLKDEASCTRAQELRRQTKAQNTRVARRKRTPVPTLIEWNGAPEVRVNGADELNCETKIVRDWLRVSCRGANKRGGKPMFLKVTRGRELGTYTFAAKDEVISLVTPFARGMQLEALFTWGDVSAKLVLHWPRGTARPGIVGSFKDVKEHHF